MNKLNEIIELIKPKSIILGDDVEFGKKYTKRITDVRSAAFYAFGDSKATNKNVVLVIDGEYLPSTYTVLTEAWFQKTNLIVIALYDSIYDIETNYLNRCTVVNMKFIDKDLEMFENKIIDNLKLIGPKVLNVVTNKKKNKIDYTNYLKELDKLINKNDVVYVYNSLEYKSKYNLIDIPKKYKYGIISKYLANLEGKTNKNILICSKDCVEVDSNILNNREMNNNFKMVVIGDISKSKDWILKNNILYKVVTDLKKDLEVLVNSEEPIVLVVKEDE